MNNLTVIYNDGSLKINGESYGSVSKSCSSQSMPFGYTTKKGKDVVLDNAVYVCLNFTDVINQAAVEEILEIENESV
jgi:hypothetical protein